MSLSSVRSDTARRSRWFSFSSSLSRASCDRPIPHRASAIDRTSAASRRSDAQPRRSSRLVPAELQPDEASIQSLQASLFFQPSLILQLRDKTIPIDGPLQWGHSIGTTTPINDLKFPAHKVRYAICIAAFSDELECLKRGRLLTGGFPNANG